MVIPCILIGLVSGFVSIFLGVGAGVIMVPSMVFFLDFPMKLAVGTSLAAMIPIAVTGALRNMQVANVNWQAFLLIGGSAVVASFLGSFLVQYVPEHIIKKLFAVLLIFVAIKLIR